MRATGPDGLQAPLVTATATGRTAGGFRITRVIRDRTLSKEERP